LKVCSVCACKNSIKVFIPVENMNDKALAEHWPSHCWMRTTVSPSASDTPDAKASP
jgi:hypothetical protein